jgi:hypothetical protein
VERNAGGNKRTAGLEITRQQQHQRRQKLEEQAIPNLVHFGMVSSGTHQQSYSRQYIEQPGSDRQRLYPDIFLTTRPSSYQFSHGRAGACSGSVSGGSGGAAGSVGGSPGGGNRGGGRRPRGQGAKQRNHENLRPEGPATTPSLK